MAVVMQLGCLPNGDKIGFEGQYLYSFDFEAFDGRGSITMTAKLAEAKQFSDMAEALEFYHRSPECRPIREDGKPNRPLTATNWAFHTVLG